LPSDTDAPEASESAPGEEVEAVEAPRDEKLEALLDQFTAELGDAVVGSHIRVDDTLWVRVNRDAWRDTVLFVRHTLSYKFFDFLSGIDWMPSPFGRDMDAQEDLVLNPPEPKDDEPMTTGYAGGDTRFQVLARFYGIAAANGVILKVDLPDDDLSIDTISNIYAGADWHERETAEMFGFTFNGHPNPRKLYLPLGFEGHPLRKDFPLLARRVKPWPGIVDVEPMPVDPNAPTDEAEGDETGEASE
jgi:NADH-quinone oxidoreductase subunit C